MRRRNGHRLYFYSRTAPEHSENRMENNTQPAAAFFAAAGCFFCYYYNSADGLCTVLYDIFEEQAVAVEQIPVTGEDELQLFDRG